jgi:hypothetical protein
MASTLNGLCIGQLQPQMLVFTRLDTDCTPLTGADDQVRSACFAQMTASPQYDDGQEFGRRAANGVRCWYVRDCDKFKQIDLTAQLITWDMELVELVTSSELQVGKTGGTWDGDAIGFAMPGIDASCPTGVSTETYTKAAFGAGGFCASSESDAPTYIRHAFPFNQWRFGDLTFDDNTDGILLNLAGFGLANPNWADGPNNDWEAEGGIPASAPYAAVFSDDLPTETCGYVDPNS